jgi:hypothetical protein
VSFQNTGGSDLLAALLLREVVATAGTSEPIPSLSASAGLSGDTGRCDLAVAAFLNHRILTHLIRQYEIADVDLTTLSVDKTIWENCSTSTVVPHVRGEADNRIRLDQIAAVLNAHRDIQKRIVARLAESFPQSFLVMFGQGISLTHEYAERFSHDIDLVVASPTDGRAIVELLRDLGFDTTEARSGIHRGVAFSDWCLDTQDLDGHTMHVDLSTGAITRSDSWLRPVVLPDLFDAARVVTLPHSAGSTVLVPNDAHQLLLLAEKAQRTQRYDSRVRCDASVLMRDDNVDHEFVAESARRAALTNSLRWILGGEVPRRGQDHRGARDRLNAFLISQMAYGTFRQPPLHEIAARAFRHVCA